MFAKVFYQIFESSIAEDYLTRHVFMDLLVLADNEGVIDKTPGAISRITNVPHEVVELAIQKLCQPDPKSRTADEEGRRLVLIDEHRDWGWRIVNYGKYRDIRDEEARRLSNRSYKRMQRQRERQLKSDGVLDSQLMSGSVSAGQSKSAHTEAEAEAEADKKESSLRSPKKVRNESAPQPTPATVIQKFQAMPAYAALNVRHEWDRMSAWCITNRKQPSEKRFCNWLLRAEVPLNGHSPPMDRHEANKLKRQELVFQRLIEEGIVKP